MEILKKRIVKDGLAIGTEVLKVDSFLNHQVDVTLFELIGADFRMRFDSIADQVDKILTVEASGIAIAAFTARYFGSVPVVFAKKERPATMGDDFYTSQIMSFTKGKATSIFIDKKFLKAGERCLIIDDFLAHGQAALGIADLAAQAGAEVLGGGFVIEKAFQGGGDLLRQRGIRVESLAIVDHIDDGVITFAE
jgi:xanthine phosphoribosyltransferase